MTDELAEAIELTDEEKEVVAALKRFADAIGVDEVQAYRRPDLNNAIQLSYRVDGESVILCGSLLDMGQGCLASPVFIDDIKDLERPWFIAYMKRQFNIYKTLASLNRSKINDHI